MGSDRKPLVNGAVIALALALLLAAHGAHGQLGWSSFGLYAYWSCRIGMAWVIIVGSFALMGNMLAEDRPCWMHVGLATLVSFPPFVMAVTMLDLIAGYHPLMQEPGEDMAGMTWGHAASLIDDHIIISIVLLSPWFLRSSVAVPEAPRQETPAETPAPVFPAVAEIPEEEPEEEAEAMAEAETPGLLLAAQPPIEGELLAIEAQEHYVKVKATGQGGMALYRFGDAVRELGRYPGMQIHRSHWVADIAVQALIGKRGTMKLELTSGEILPISRRYEQDVEARYPGLERRPE